MGDWVLGLVLDESKWPATSMIVASLVLAVRVRAQRRRGLGLRFDILWAMNAFYGWMIGIMAFGHLLAVGIEAVQGTLEGSLPLLVLLGVALGVPSWWLALRAGSLVAEEGPGRRRLLALNVWLVACLLAVGVHNGPLAAPGALNVAYQLHSRRVVGWTIVTAAVVSSVAMLIGSLYFLASGQSFEQFKGM